MIYATLGLSTIFFTVHAIFLRGLGEANGRMSPDWMRLMAILNLTGAAARGVRLPEKQPPGHFQYVDGSSHQILHFMVSIAEPARVFDLLRAFRHYCDTLYES